jgi:class 3 adenylate cyclase
MGTFARRDAAPDYPIDVPNLDPTPETWGLPLARAFVRERAPSIAEDEDAIAWYASYLVRGASPGAAAALLRMNEAIDVRPVLPTIGVPALVLFREDEYLREATRYMGERIPGARVRALPGADHLPWEGDQDAVLDEIEAFLAGVRDDEEPDHVLTTLLCARADRGDALRTLLRNLLPRFRGDAIDGGDDAAWASFDGPARAVRCARALLEAAEARGLAVRAGLHTGECALTGGRADGPAVAAAAGVADAAAPGELLASATVRDLLAGSGVALREHPAAPAGRPLYAG